MAGNPATAPRASELRPELRLVLWTFAGLALIAGALLFIGSQETDDWFSWTIQPALTAAFLGSAYWAAALLLAWTASRSDWPAARPALLPVSVIAVLLLVATLVHFDRFHRDLFGWFWLCAYIAVPPVLAAALWLQLRGRAGPASAERIAPDPAPPVRLPGALRALLLVQGVVLLGLGAALFIAPTDAADLWPWEVTPLTARAVGAFLVGFGAAALHAVVENAAARFRAAALAWSLLGVLELVAAARHSADFSGGSTDTWLYLAFVSSVVAAGAYGALSARAAG